MFGRRACCLRGQVAGVGGRNGNDRVSVGAGVLRASEMVILSLQLARSPAGSVRLGKAERGAGRSSWTLELCVQFEGAAE